MSSKATVPRDELLAAYAANRHKTELIILGSISAVLLTEIGMHFPSAWVNIFLIIVSWTVSDFAVETFVIKRRGVVDVPVIGWRITRRSWAVVAYLIGIVVGSLFGDLVGKIVLGSIPAQDLRESGAGLIYLTLSFLMFVLVFYDLQFRTYGQDRRKEKAKQPKEAQQPANSTSE